MIRSDEDPIGFISMLKPYSASHLLSLYFFHTFCLQVRFSRGFFHYLGLYCPFVYISLHARYFFNSLYSFQCVANC